MPPTFIVCIRRKSKRFFCFLARQSKMKSLMMRSIKFKNSKYRQTRANNIRVDSTNLPFSSRLSRGPSHTNLFIQIEIRIRSASGNQFKANKPHPQSPDPGCTPKSTRQRPPQAQQEPIAHSQGQQMAVRRQINTLIIARRLGAITPVTTVSNSYSCTTTTIIIMGAILITAAELGPVP